MHGYFFQRHFFFFFFLFAGHVKRVLSEMNFFRLNLSLGIKLLKNIGILLIIVNYKVITRI